MAETHCFNYLRQCGDPVVDTEENTENALSLLNINYKIKEFVGPWWKGACFRKRHSKSVLKNINVQFRSGEMTAILGSSGSGKTSLLDIITSRYTGKMTGQVYFNNCMCTPDVIREYAAYVMQADRLLHNLTVRETLRYSGILRLPGHCNSKEIDAEVDRVILDMGLKQVADSKIGGSIERGISGGERRRVTIAIQLLQNPKILLLDEPTTGLDSYTTRNLICSLSGIAHAGKIVITTVHQPRSDLFKLFDRICLLSMGEVVYFGRGNEMVDYFEKLGFPCPTYANPLDHFVDLTSIDRRDDTAHVTSFSRVDKFIREYSVSKVQDDILKTIEECTMKPSSRSTMVRINRPHPPNVFTVMSCLIWRMLVNLGRDRSIYISRLIMLTLYVPFILAFLGRLKNNQESIQDRMGLLYQSTNVPLFVAILVPVAVFPPLRDLYYRECRDGLYSTTTFIFSYILHIIPFHGVSSLLFCIIVYWVTGLQPSWTKFGIFYADVSLLHFIGEIMTVGIMGVFYSAQVSQSVASLFISATTLFSAGFIRTLPDILEIFSWLSWAIPMKYGAEIAVANEFHELNISCSAGAPCQYPTGDMYLDQFYPDSVEHMQRNFYALGGFIVFFVISTILAFRIRGIPNLH